MGERDTEQGAGGPGGNEAREAERAAPPAEATGETPKPTEAQGAEAEPAGAPEPRTPRPQGAAWGAPLRRFEKAWARFEVKLAVGVLIAEVMSLCAWVFLKGLSTPASSGKAGVVFRAVATALALGLLTWRLLRDKPERFRSTATTIAAAAGLFVGRLWAGVGVQYGSEILNWYQDASALTLIGGLRGVGTRLTAWLAMLGASLATSSGKHINIDVVMRFLPTRARVVAAGSAWLAAAAVCFAATWGFIDHIAVASFQAPREASAGQKLGVLTHELGEQLFIVRRQLGLDLKVGTRVFLGKKYTESLSGAEWNAHVREGGYEAWFTPEQVKALAVADESKAVSPLVIVPGKNQRGLLIEALNLLFPFGFLMMGFKFLLRVLLVFSGHVVVDPDAMHRDDDEEEEGEAAGAAGGGA